MPAERVRRVLLLGNDPADMQWSMLDYANQLARALASAAGPALKIDLRSPDSSRWAWTRRGRIGRAAGMYFSRYVLYPRVIRRESANLYHLLDHGNASLLPRRLDPQRTIVTCHDLIPLLMDQPGSLLPGLSRRAFDQALTGLKHAARIIANSPCTRRDLIQRLGIPGDRIAVIPLGISPDFSPAPPQEKEAARKRFGIPEGQRVILHVGQNVPYKNFEGLLETVRVLAERNLPVLLLRAGPVLSPHQRGRTPVPLLELGPLPKEQLPALYHAADLLLYPSWYEGLGLPPLEALASGVPVLVSDRGALPETVGEAGLVANPSSPARMADEAQRLLEDQALRERLRVLGLKRASLFSWEEAASRTLSVYRSVI